MFRLSRFPSLNFPFSWGLAAPPWAFTAPITGKPLVLNPPLIFPALTPPLHATEKLSCVGTKPPLYRFWICQFSFQRFDSPTASATPHFYSPCQRRSSARKPSILVGPLQILAPPIVHIAPHPLLCFHGCCFFFFDFRFFFSSSIFKGPGSILGPLTKGVWDFPRIKRPDPPSLLTS